MTKEQEQFAEEQLEANKSEAIDALNWNAQLDSVENIPASDEEPTTEQAELEKLKLPNGYIPGVIQVDNTDYAADLAARIATSNFPVTRVAFLDYKALYNAGLLKDQDVNSPLPLKTGQRLVVDKTPDCARATYWNHVE